MRFPNWFKIIWWVTLLVGIAFLLSQRYDSFLNGTTKPFDIVIFVSVLRAPFDDGTVEPAPVVYIPDLDPAQHDQETMESKIFVGSEVAAHYQNARTAAPIPQDQVPVAVDDSVVTGVRGPEL